jgi:hypothetical protein
MSETEHWAVGCATERWCPDEDVRAAAIRALPREVIIVAVVKAAEPLDEPTP